MEATCPHCGSRLPAPGDAFCPQCRNAVDEPPAVPLTPRQQEAVRDVGAARALQVGGWLMLAGVVYWALTKSGVDATIAIVTSLFCAAFALGEAARRSARARTLRQRRDHAGNEKGDNAEPPAAGGAQR